jgi:hypothetical protein
MDGLHKHEPRNVPRYGVLNLLQIQPNCRDSEEFVLTFLQWPLAQLLLAPEFSFVSSPERKSSPSGDTPTAPITPGSRPKSTLRGAYSPF